MKFIKKEFHYNQIYRMRKLEQQLTKNKFLYTQLDRTDKVAIYEQKHPEAGVVSYEVFKIRIAKESVMFGVTVPEKESFPSDEAFGVTAWSIRDKERAFKRFKELADGN